MEFFSRMTDKGTNVQMQRASGFTLIELMVYIALLGGIVLIAGQAFSDSTKMRVRTQSMLQASETAGRAVNMMMVHLMNRMKTTHGLANKC